MAPTDPSARADGVREPMPGIIYPDAGRLARYLTAGELPREGLIEGFIASMKTNAERPALWCDDRHYTYRELDELTDRSAAGFLAMGMRPLDRALFQMRNSVEFYIAFLGCLKAGIIPICSLMAHREYEIEYLGIEGHARMHVVDGDDPRFDLVQFALKVQSRVPTIKYVVSARGAEVDGVTSLASLVEGPSVDGAAAAVAAVPRDPFQVAIFQLSGGTTGVPKIIPRLQNDYLLNMRLTVERLGYRPDDTMFIGYPPIHNAAMGCCWGPTLLAGGCVAVLSDLSAAGFKRVLDGAKPTWIGQLVSGLTPYFKEAEVMGASFDSVRALWQAGSNEMADQARAWIDVPTWVMFGMTEGLNLYPREGDPEEAWRTTMGRPLSDYDEVLILEPGSEREVPAGAIGEMTCRGPFITSGYFNSPARNAEAFTSDGFYRSGDLMSRQIIDGVSFYRFEGRLKDVISRGGEKINAAEVEGALLRHPSVLQVAVVGYPCDRLGERACALVVLEAGHEPFDMTGVRAFMEEFGLAKFKWPERVDFIEAIALTKVGKVDKATMRKALLARIAAELTPDAVHTA